MMGSMRSGLATIVVIAAIAACGGGRGGPTTPQERGRVRLVRCRAAPPLPTLDAETRAFGKLVGILGGEVENSIGSLDAAGGALGKGFGVGPAAAPAAPEVDPAMPWTPFALDAAEAASASEQMARAAEGALRGRLAAIDACFGSSPVTGSLRAMLAVDLGGALTSVRAGGLGDRAIEACVENAVTGMRVMLPSEASGELACDLSRGDAQLWRLTLDRSGYGVVEISRTRVRYGDQMLSSGEDVDALADHTIFLLVADADATGAMLALAM